MQMEPHCIDSSLTTLLRRWLSFIKAASAGSFKGLCLINLSDFNTQFSPTHHTPPSPSPCSLPCNVTHSAHSDHFSLSCGVQGRKQVDWLMVCLINGDTSTRWRLAYRLLTAALPRWQKPHYSSNIGRERHAPGGAIAQSLARLSGYEITVVALTANTWSCPHSRTGSRYTHTEHLEHTYTFKKN